MTELEKLQLKAQESISFFDQHPAICGSINPVFSAIDFSIAKVWKFDHVEFWGRISWKKYGDQRRDEHA